MPYVYELKDKVTGKWYVGSRIASGCCPSELGVGYFSSSSLVKNLFKTDKNRFMIQILVEAEDEEYILKVERDILIFRNAKYDESSYNMHHNDGKMNTVKSGKATRDLKQGFHSWKFDQFSEHNKKNGQRTYEQKKGVHGRTLEEMRKHTAMTNAQRWRCDVCGMETIPMALGRHQKYSGHVGKTRII